MIKLTPVRVYIIIGCVVLIVGLGYSYIQQQNVEGYTDPVVPTNRAIYTYFTENKDDIKTCVSKDGKTGESLYKNAVAFFNFTGSAPSADTAELSPKNPLEIFEWFNDTSSTGAKNYMLKAHPNFANSLMNFIGVPENMKATFLH